MPIKKNGELTLERYDVSKNLKPVQKEYICKNGCTSKPQPAENFRLRESGHPHSGNCLLCEKQISSAKYAQKKKEREMFGI